MAQLKGNLIVGQSGGPTAVINCSLAGVIQEALRHDVIGDIYGMIHGIEGVLKENIIDLRAEAPETIEGLRQTPSSALGACRTKLKAADYERIIKVLQAHDVRYFVYIGGNDSADTCHHVEKLAQETGYELRAIAVPKTVDNDLAYTDHCPGYGSVARFNAIATRDSGRDTDAIGIVDNVKIIETMGRNAGWITASTALAKEHADDAPHLIYLPERAFDMQEFLEDVKATFDRLGHCLITVCEGLRDDQGVELVASKRAVDTDGFGHKQLGGVADFLCQAIADNLKLKARFDKPGTIQRMSVIAASPVDQQEAYLVGKTAVAAAVDGVSGQMITLVRESNSPYRVTTGLAPLEAVANAEHCVPPEFINERGNFVTERFIEYARPLIGGELPRYVRLAGKRVPPKL